MPGSGIRQPESSNWLEELHSAIASSETPESVPVATVETVTADELARVRDCLVDLERYRRSSAAGSTIDLGVGESREVPAAESEWNSPQSIGRFEIKRPLGSGSHGLVFLAFDPVLKRQVALKVPRPEVLASADLRRRFVREAHAAARIAHQNVVAVHEVVDSGPISFIAWEYCPGESLAEFLRRQQHLLDSKLAAKLVAQIADGVQAAHDQGVLHRDLKPANVLLFANSGANLTTSGPGVPKITDFGLAKIDGTEADPTRTGALVGTLAYMAPEQADCRLGAVGAQADVYGLGAILYETLIGRPPFKELNEADTLRRLLADEPVAPRRLRSDLPIDLEAVCLKCLEKRPADRYETAAEVAADLRRVLSDEPTQARPLNSRQRLLKWAQRRPALAGLIAVSGVAAALLFGGGSLYTVQIGRAYADSERRRIEAAQASEAAEAHRQAAEASRIHALRERDANEGFRYAAQMRSAFAALGQGDVRAAESALDDYADGTRSSGMRGMEWYYLKHSLHGEQQSLLGHQGEVYAVAWSPDGSQFVSGGQDGTIRVWDPDSGQSLHTIAAHESCANDLVFTPDGRVLVSVSCDRTVKLWDPVTWQQLATLSADDAREIHSADISLDGVRLATGEHGGWVRIWSISDRILLREFLADEPESTVHSLDWSDDGKFLAISAHKTAIWNTDTWQKIGSKDVQGANSVVFLPDGNRLAMAFRDRSVRVRDVRAEYDDWYSVQRASVNKAAYCAAANQLLVATNGAIDILPLPEFDSLAQAAAPAGRATRKPNGRLIGHVGRVQDLAISPDGRRAASAGFDSTVRVWDLSTEGTSSSRFCVSVSTRGVPILSGDFARLAFANEEDRLVTWDIAHSQELFNTPTSSTGTIWQFRNGGDVVVEQWPFPGSLLVWRRSSPDQLISPSVQYHTLVTYSLSGDGKVVAGLGLSGLMSVREWQKDKTVYERQLAISSDPVVALNGLRGRVLLLSNTGRWLLTGAGNSFEIVETASGIERQLPLSGGFDGISFSPQDRILAATLGDAVHIYDIASGTRMQSLQNSSRIISLAITSDEQSIAMATADGRVSMWHIPTGQELGTLIQFDEPIVNLQISDDDQRLAAITQDRTAREKHANVTVYVWQAPVEQAANAQAPR